MPMTGPALATAIKTAIAGVPDPKDFNSVWNAIGNALVTFITTNAVVTLTAATATGVTAGPAAVPVTGVGVLS